MNVHLASASFGLLSLLLLGGCSLINAPSDEKLATGGSGGTTSSGGTGGTGGAPECTGDNDCTDKATECADSTCGQDGKCTPQPKAMGTACGPAPTSTCDLPDTCDGAGKCTANAAPNGTFCADCPAGPGNCAACAAGKCNDCSGTRATVKSFVTPLSASGWTLTGGWRIYDWTPPSFEGMAPSAVFAHPVLGTDGNRSNPYPGGEHESSSATSPPTVLPATVDFLSWNWDEGFQFDLKAVQVSNDGTNWQSIAVCPQGGMPQFAFCNAWNPLMPRAIDAWDPISLPVPAEFVGKVGFVRFVMDTKDGCCDWEQGWYIDALNVATDCACAGDASCGYLDGPCGTGTCDATGECRLTPKATGDVCTFDAAPVDADCSMPACDANGWCNSGFMSFEKAPCATCPEGTGDCNLCSMGECRDCPPIQTFANFASPNWVFTGSWNAYNGCLPANSVDPMGTPCFPGATTIDDPQTAPFLGNIGSRTGEFPWAGDAAASKIETSTVTMATTVFPKNLTFKSWHQDRGGNDTFNLKDKKQIKISTDGGATFTTIVSCEGNSTLPFCQPWPAFTNRSVDMWDSVTIPVPDQFVGMKGMMQILYDTVDAGEGWERGWYLDDLNFNRCDVYTP